MGKNYAVRPAAKSLADPTDDDRDARIAELTAVGFSPKDAAIVDGLTDALGEELAEFDRRLKAMEDRPVPTYRGIWKQKTPYARGSFVTFGGSVWHGNDDDNTDKPGASEAWTLCVKKGRDAKQHRTNEGEAR